MSHDGILIHNSHSAKHLACFTSDRDGHIDVVPFGHRDLGGSCFSFVAELPEAKGEELSFRDLSDHLCEFLLLKLESCDRLAKLDALLRVA